MRELTITALAAGGDGLGRDETGRVTFVPRTAPGDRVRVRIEKESKTFARGEIDAIVEAGPARVEPPCVHFREGCGGCAWQHVAMPAQLDAKQANVETALRKLGATIHRIESPAPPLGWRRRARFHVENGVVGLFAYGSHRLVRIRSCPQLEPALDAALDRAVAARPPDGELYLAVSHDGQATTSGPVQIDPGITIRVDDFAQASTAGNRALIARAVAALGPGPGTLLELHAGAGNLTRGYTAAGWTVTPTDVVEPMVKPARWQTGSDAEVLRRSSTIDAIALDPPRTGAPDAIPGILRLSPRRIVYVSCDPATLARDAAKLVEAGYRATDAWPLDLMPQTAHVEVVLSLLR